MKEIYLDNAATTKVCESAITKMTEVLGTVYGNPSSLHRKGQEAERFVTEARKKLADILRVDPSSLYFTSGATESTNTALRGAAESRIHQGKHILTSKGEHSATRETLKCLSSRGWEIEYLENDETGRVLISDLENKLRSDTVLVTCLHVNNETGCIHPIQEMGAVIRKIQPTCYFHVDAVQSFAKIPVFPAEWGIDFLSTSAHKINGPKGIGFLYIRRGIHIPGLIYGGGQEKQFRSGTENVPGIVGFGQAASEMWQMHQSLQEQMYHQKLLLYHGLTDALTDISVNGPAPEEGAAHILNIQVEGVRSEVLLHTLENYGIYISSGSACASNKPSEKSPSLAAIGRNVNQIDSAIRISFGRYTTENDIQEMINAMKSVVPTLRRFIRK